jgi:hypothetical protein
MPSSVTSSGSSTSPLVEHHQRVARGRHGVLAALPAAEPERAGGRGEPDDRALRLAQQRWRVPGRGVPEDAVGRLDEDAGGGAEDHVGHGRHVVVQLGQERTRAVDPGGQGAGHDPQLPHGERRLDAVTDHVTHQQGVPPGAERDHVVPVATRVEHRRRRQVPTDRARRQVAGEQPALQVGDDVVLGLVEPVPFADQPVDSLAGQPRAEQSQGGDQQDPAEPAGELSPGCGERVGGRALQHHVPAERADPGPADDLVGSSAQPDALGARAGGEGAFRWSAAGTPARR